MLEGLKIRESKGIIPPRFVVDEVLKEMNEFVATPAEKNILATSFKTRAAKITKLTDQQRSDYQGRVEGAINGSVYPAYHKLIDYFTALQPKTTTDDGVWKLPDGEAFYAHKLRENTTTTLKPHEVHALGVSESRGSRPRCARCSTPTVSPAADRRGHESFGERSAVRLCQRRGRTKSRHRRIHAANR